DPDEDESATVSYARAPLVIETEAELKTAINSIDTRPGKPAWWAAVAELDDAHKRANPKYTYRELAELLGFEEKHTGRMVRKHRPKTHQNTPKQRPKSG